MMAKKPMLSLILGTGLMAVIMSGSITSALALNKESDERQFEDKATKRFLATAVDFARELGLSFASLSDLGTRIERSRQALDPVGLAAAAVELSAAEKASGKAASIKSADLMKEAVELAKERNFHQELKAVASMTDAEATKRALLKQSVEAEKALAARKQAQAEGEVEKGIMCYLTARNCTSCTVTLCVNGREVCLIPPYSSCRAWVGDPRGSTTRLYASGCGGHWSRNVYADARNYTWTLRG